MVGVALCLLVLVCAHPCVCVCLSNVSYLGQYLFVLDDVLVSGE